MRSNAHARYVRISPQKVRTVVPLIRNKRVDKALAVLDHTPRRAAFYLAKVIRGAVANAVSNHAEAGLSSEKMWVDEVLVDGGPAAKKYRAMTMGRAGVVRRRTSHIKIQLTDVKAE